MGIKLADAVTYLTADSSKLDSTLRESEHALTRWGSVAQGIMMGAGIAIFNAVASGVRTAVGEVGDAITKASDLGETISKAGVLFGDNADQLVAWSEQAAASIGQSQQSALDAAATFATFGRAAGLSGEDLVDFSTGFTGLASDLASFNNTTPEQAIQAIGAALRGESEPLRAYGVLIDDASMRQAALKLGLIETTKEALTPQQKVLAAQALIYEQTAAAQGDFARTSDSLANSQRSLTAQWDDMKTVIGQALLPVMQGLVSWASDMLSKAAPAVQGFVNILQPLLGYLFATIETGDDRSAFGYIRQLPEWLQPIALAVGEKLVQIKDFFGALFTTVGEWLGGFKLGLDGSATDADGWAGKLGTTFGTVRDWLQTNFFDKVPVWWKDFKDGLDGSAKDNETWAAKAGLAFNTAATNLRTFFFNKLPNWWAEFRTGFDGNEEASNTWAGKLGVILGTLADSVGEDVGRILESLGEMSTWFGGEGTDSARGWGEALLTILDVVGKAIAFMVGIVADLINAMELAGRAFEAIQAGDWDTVAQMLALARDVAGRTNPLEFMGELWDELQKMFDQRPTPPGGGGYGGPETGTGNRAAMALPGAWGTQNNFTVQLVATGNGPQDVLQTVQFMQAMYA